MVYQGDNPTVITIISYIASNEIAPSSIRFNLTYSSYYPRIHIKRLYNQTHQYCYQKSEKVIFKVKKLNFVMSNVIIEIRKTAYDQFTSGFTYK